MGQKKVLINLCAAPFGTIFYTEGLRAVVGVSAGMDENITTVLFQSDGVYYCLKDVDRTDAQAYFASMQGMGTGLFAVKEDLAVSSAIREKRNAGKDCNELFAAYHTYRHPQWVHGSYPKR